MDKCREAFEIQTHLTLYIANLVFDEKEDRYIPNEKLIRTFEEWEWKAFSNQAWGVNLAWWSWQSRQAELDQLNKVLGERTKEWLEAIKLGAYFQEAAKPLKDEVEEKDKRIKQATAKWISIVTILTTTDTGVPDVIFKQLDQLHDALCGMNEIGDNNANS